jgi:hypothetical protein
MNHLFSSTFIYNQIEQTFAIHKLADNLYQARGDLHVVVLWKNSNKWEGAGTIEDPSLVEMIGNAIDKHLSTINSV